MITDTKPLKKNIAEIYQQFPTHKDCIKYLEEIRWQGKPICPYCESDNSTPYRDNYRHHCNSCNTSYSVTVKTIFHKTKLDFQKWFIAIPFVLNSSKKVSAKQLAKEIHVTKNTSWYLLTRLRSALIKEGDLLNKIIDSNELTTDQYISSKQTLS